MRFISLWVCSMRESLLSRSSRDSWSLSKCSSMSTERAFEEAFERQLSARIRLPATPKTKASERKLAPRVTARDSLRGRGGDSKAENPRATPMQSRLEVGCCSAEALRVFAKGFESVLTTRAASLTVAYVQCVSHHTQTLLKGSSHHRFP